MLEVEVGVRTLPLLLVRVLGPRVEVVVAVLLLISSVSSPVLPKPPPMGGRLAAPPLGGPTPFAPSA